MDQFTHTHTQTHTWRHEHCHIVVQTSAISVSVTVVSTSRGGTSASQIPHPTPTPIPIQTPSSTPNPTLTRPSLVFFKQFFYASYFAIESGKRDRESRRKREGEREDKDIWKEKAVNIALPEYLKLKRTYDMCYPLLHNEPPLFLPVLQQRHFSLPFHLK